MLKYAAIGGALGACSLLVLPGRVHQYGMGVRVVLPVVGAVLSGWAMSALGAWRARHARTSTPLATFWVGAVFALAFAAARAIGHAL